MDDNNQKNQVPSQDPVNQPGTIPPSVPQTPVPLSAIPTPQTDINISVTSPSNTLDITPSTTEPDIELPPPPAPPSPETSQVLTPVSVNVNINESKEVEPITPVSLPEPPKSPFTSLEQTTTQTTTTTTTTEAPLPTKKKNKVLPTILAVVAVLVIGGIAGASYFVSNRLSQQAAVAPNAPESQPQAGGACSGDYGNCGSSYCVSNTCVKTCCYKKAGKYDCSGGNNCFTGADGCSNCGGSSSSSSSSGGGCPSIPNQGSTGPAGSSCDSSNCGGSCNRGGVNYGFKCGTLCYKDDCGASACGGGSGPTCESSKRDTPSSNSITFSKAGKVILFTRSGYAASTVTLTGPKTVTIPFGNGNAVQQPTTFQVNANETYTIKIRINAESKDSYGWRPNKSTNICGPSNADCGGDADITAVRNLANANSDMTGITAGGAAANIQCWGDAQIGDETQDFDYNDFTVIFGYEKQTREDLCDKASPSTVNKSSIAPGETVVLTSYTNDSSVTGFHYATYNMDNLYPAPPAGNPKPVCVAGATADPSQCPNGGGVLIFNGTKDTANPKKGSTTLTYAQIFDVTDTNTGQKPKNVKFSSYFSKGGPWSLPQGECQMLLSAGTAAPACVAAKLAYKNAAGAWVKINNDQIATYIKSGDLIRVYANGNSTATKVRFRVTQPDGTQLFSPEWKDGTAETVSGVISYFVEFTLNKSGAYTFEAEVQ